MRVFISINLPQKVTEKIKLIQEKLPDFFGKKTQEKNLHLTLKFLGEIDEKELEEIKEKLKEINFSKIKCTLDSIGVFSEDFIRIVWLHLSGAEELQREIDKKLQGFFKKEKRFMSHITIARVKKIKNKEKFLDELKKIKFNEIQYIAESFYLMKSDLKNTGAVHMPLAEFKLR